MEVKKEYTPDVADLAWVGGVTISDKHAALGIERCRWDG